MKLFSLASKALMALALFGSLATVGCKKNSDDKVNVGNVPHKAVPEPFQGDFQWTQVSSTGYEDQYGGSYSALTVGVAAHLNANGTGTWVFRYDITYSTGRQKSVHIDSDVAYEITKLSEDRANVIVHFIRGKNYEDGQFLHDLDASKIYPNGDFVFNNIEYGVNEQGKIYFKTDPTTVFVKK